MVGLLGDTPELMININMISTGVVMNNERQNERAGSQSQSGQRQSERSNQTGSAPKKNIGERSSERQSGSEQSNKNV